MTRRSNALPDDHYGSISRPNIGTAGLALFDPPAPQEPAKAPEQDSATRAACSYLSGQLALLYRDRANAFQLGARDEIPFVTADDADRFLGEWDARPIELAIRGNNWRAHIFNRRVWYRITGKTVPSTRDHMNGTDMACWALREEAAA